MPKSSISFLRWFTSPRYVLCAAVLVFLALPAAGRDKKDAVHYGAGLIVNLPAPESEVVNAVQEVVQNGIIRGTKEYSKDEYISGATPAPDSRYFPTWTEGGKVFYKIRLHALDPLNFKNTNDVGTVAVRYIVTGQDETHTVLRIDAVFAEDYRHTVHASNGSVESSEYKQIHDRLDAFELIKQETAEAEKKKQVAAEQKVTASVSLPEASKLAATQAIPEQRSGATPQLEPSQEDAHTVPSTAPKSLDEQVKELRRQVERLVKAPGTNLKAAPYQKASNLQALPSGAEVLIVISTPYWYGVETHDGQHGWVPRDDLEELP